LNQRTLNSFLKRLQRLILSRAAEEKNDDLLYVEPMLHMDKTDLWEKVKA
jgi:hypothetical protein